MGAGGYVMTKALVTGDLTDDELEQLARCAAWGYGYGNPMITRLIAEVRRRRAEAQRIPEYGWQCSRCGEDQVDLPAYPAHHPCKACGAAMCAGCRSDAGYCNDTCERGDG